MNSPAATPTKEKKAMRERIVTESPITVTPLTDEEKQRGLEALKQARVLREAMLKRRRGKLVPSSWRLIRQARDEAL